jgi:leucyl-tRNA synthetase
MTFELYDHAAVESKWRRLWEERGTNHIDVATAERPFYNLMMFPYPSAEGLHVGHIIPFGGADIYGRWRRLKGDAVFEPMGFDAFGIHSENYAMKIGEHPAVMMRRAVNNFRENQLKKIGSMFDWQYQVNTADPGYYKWTQWVFITLFNAGLVEWREGAVNWCPSCMTVLADEQVEQGQCERCDSVVEQRYLKQWWLKITRYAQEMLDAIDELDWSESTKLMQRNWIGRSEGAKVRFELSGCERSDVTVFTTRPDTLFGATFLVIGADHPDLLSFCDPARAEMVRRWRESLPPAGDEPDFSVGIDLGSHGVNPVNGARIPVFAAPYVLGGYGTGAIMAVPAHDERDHAFALRHDLPIVQVITSGDGQTHDIRESAYTGPGVLTASGDFDGDDWQDAKRKIITRLAAGGQGELSVQYKLRDWLISRQRYWGPPIPIIHCADCGPVAVPEADLPVLLPDIEDFRPTGTGKSPLAGVEEFVNVDCPKCGKAAKRETDVSDTFLDSAWYFLRYPSVGHDDVAFDKALTEKWMPVDMYIGGNEHAVRHLLYARFVTRALHGLGLVSVPEPFKRFRAHGMLVKDGAKMSKSRGNVVNPDEYIERYGADVFRLYLMFLGPYTAGGDFRDAGIVGMTRFVEKVWRCAHVAAGPDDHDETRERRRHRVIAKVDDDIGELRYNTAIATLMEFARDLDHEGEQARRGDVKTLLQLLAPFAPYVAEELWERTGGEGSIHDSAWPVHDPGLAAAQQVTIALQVNGKVRATLEVDAGTDQETLTALALEHPRIGAALNGSRPRKVIAVVDKIVNVVP